MLNPEASNNAVATPDRPMANWMLINAPGIGSGIDFTKAETVLKYVGPVPNPKSPPQRLFFLLYEQSNGRITSGQKIAEKYSDALCASSVKGRCLFRQEAMAQDYNLTLRGVTWAATENDAFSRYFLIKQGQTEDNVCAFIAGGFVDFVNLPRLNFVYAGYAQPCPRFTETKESDATTTPSGSTSVFANPSFLFYAILAALVNMFFR